MIKVLEYTKEVMHNAIAHHSLAGAPPVPEQSAPASFPPSLYIERDVVWYGISLWPVGVSCAACAPSQFLLLQPFRWQDMRS